MTTATTATATAATTKVDPPPSTGTPRPPPSWETLDQRPLPGWYDDAKFGIFIHWGVFSVPSIKTEWFWEYWQGMKDPEINAFVNQTEAPGFSYPDYAHRFRAELYRPEEWAETFAQSGAQYIVLTSKHHEGFCMWNVSNEIPTTWNWNAVDVGPKRDLLGDLATQIKRTSSPHTNNTLKFGVYHSLFEWFNPFYLQDKKNAFQTQTFPTLKSVPELYDLVRKYEPELIWSDGEWETHSDYWKAVEFLHWYSTESAVADTAVWNDRWGNDTLCKHGAFLTCADRYQPNGYQTKKWEDALTIDKSSWGLNRNSTSLSDYLTVKELIDKLIVTISLNGNMLLNVGPAADGTIHPIFIDRLLGIGEWLKVNGEAVYATKPWKVCQNETRTVKRDVNDGDESPLYYYVRKEDRLYVHMTQWPVGNILELDCPTPTDQTQVRFLGLDSSSTVAATSGPEQHQQHQPQWWKRTTTVKNSSASRRVKERRQRTRRQTTTASERMDNVVHGNDEHDQVGMTIQLPALTPDIIPCQHAWVLEITGLANLDDDDDHDDELSRKISSTTIFETQNRKNSRNKKQ